MSTEYNKSDGERVRLTNIVGETKRNILDEPDSKTDSNSLYVTDNEIKKAVERINPDPHSLTSRG